MKRNTKILIICLAVVLVAAIVVIALLLNKSYTDEYTAEELYSKVINSFVTDGGNEILDSDVILEFSEENIPYLESYIVVKAKNAKNINEIGIFKIQNGKPKDMKSLVDAYVSNLQQAYRSMDYFPEEVEKIDCATVKIFGNYVVYSFLNENDTESFYDTIEKTLTK